MYYGDKREAKVNIMHELESRGWKVYGFRADESDSMTDYYSPAYWDGIASKNGFVLLVDVYGTSDSGYKKTTQTIHPDYAKIKKLQTLANDSGATAGEKQAALHQIQKLEEKAENSVKVVEEYPTFAHANPKNCSWHIEFNGQIVAKGTGVFSCYVCNDHMEPHKNERITKVNAFCDRIEKEIRDNTQLESEVIKVAKKAIKPVEKADKTINVNDVLSFNYHGHYWIVTNIYQNNRDETCVTYEILGSEKRGYQRLSGNSLNGKRYYQPLARLEKEMAEGKTKVYTLQEVTEYEEKTVYKKTQRKQKQNLDQTALSGDVTEQQEEQTEQPQKEHITEEKKETTTHYNEVSYTLNEEFNGIEITFASKPAQEILETLKTNSFRWSKRGFWYAKQSTERLELVKSLTGERQADTDNIEDLADTIIDISANIIIEMNFRPSEATEEQKAEYRTILLSEIQRNNYIVTHNVMSYLENVNHYSFLVDALRLLSVSLDNNTQDQTEEKQQDITEEPTICTDDILEIRTNGSKFLGQRADPIEKLYDMLKNHTLDPLFEKYGNFANQYKPLRITEENKRFIGCVSFFGNFWDYSHAFNIITNNQDVITELTNLIRKNQQTEEYKQASNQIQADERRKNILHKLHRENNETLMKKYQEKTGYNTGSISLYTEFVSSLTDEEISDIHNQITERHNSTTQTAYTYPDIDIDDIDSYTVDERLQKAEHDSSWIFRKGERDRTQEIQEHFSHYNSKVIEVLSITDSQQIIYHLKKSLQRYKKKYFENYLAQLRHKANNPSWAVTGRSGRNASKDQKAHNREDKLMHESIELTKEIDTAIDRAKTAIRKVKENHIKEQVSNITNDLQFVTETKTLTFHGVSEKLRTYNYQSYMITKTWGCFRIFRDGKEVHSMKTTEKLDDAKKYVVFLVQQDRTNKTA